MTVPQGGQPQGQFQGHGPGYPGYPPAPPPPRKKTPLPWIAAVLLVLVAVAVTLVLTRSEDDDTFGGGTASGSGTTRPEYDLSSPAAAATSLAAAAKTGNVETFMQLTCIGNSECVKAHARDVTQEDIRVAEQRIRDGIGAFAQQLDGAQLGAARAASKPGAMEVTYTAPAPGGSDEHFMVFVESGGKWYYYGGGDSSQGGGGGASAPATPSR